MSNIWAIILMIVALIVFALALFTLIFFLWIVHQDKKAEKGNEFYDTEELYKHSNDVHDFVVRSDPYQEITSISLKDQYNNNKEFHDEIDFNSRDRYRSYHDDFIKKNEIRDRLTDAELIKILYGKRKDKNE